MFFTYKKRQLALFLFLLCFFVLLSPLQALGMNAKIDVSPEIRLLLGGEDYIPLIVTFKEKADLEEALTWQKGEKPTQAIVASLQETARRSLEIVGPLLEEDLENGNIKDFRPLWLVNAFAASVNNEGLNRLLTLPGIQQIMADRRLHAPAPSSLQLSLPHNPGVTYSAQPHQDSANNTPPWNLEAVNAPGVWELGFYGRGVVVAIMDTGVDLSHPALTPKYRGHQPGHSHATSWFDVADEDGSHDGPEDFNGHGTHIAGIILGGTPEKPLGIAPGAQWIAANIFAKGYAWDSHIAEAFQWFLAPGGDPAHAPDIINCSWASKREYATDYLQWEILHNLEQAGISVFFAAGNDAENGPGSPASYPHAFAVGAVKKEGETVAVTDFSSKGPAHWQGIPYIKPEIVAPGSDITSAWLNKGYATLEGTSTAAAHVSGAAALLLESNRTLTPRQIKFILETTAFWHSSWDRYGKRPNNTYGNGLLDVYKAITQASPPAGDEVIFKDGVEEGIHNWKTSPAFPWKITRERIHSGTFAFTNPFWKNKDNPAHSSWLASANAISICGYHSPVLSFWHCYEFQKGEEEDCGYVEVSPDGDNWIRLYRFAGSSHEKFERSELPFNLPSEAKKLYFRFRLENNNNSPQTKWFLDDIAVTAAPLPLTALEQLRLEAKKQKIGIGEQLEIKAEAVFCPHLAREIKPGLLSLSSSDVSVIKVEAGILTGISAGEAIISGKFADKRAELKITVFDVQKPVAAPLPGTFINAVEVELVPSLEGSEIYYTVDGSDPDKNSIPYKNPLTLTETTVLKAKAYLHDIPGPTATFPYTIKKGTRVTGSLLLQGRPFESFGTEAFFICKDDGMSYELSPFSQEGHFSKELPQGSYILVLKKEHFLTRVVTIELKNKEGHPYQLEPLVLLAGDLNGDNKVDLTDLALLSLAYRSKAGAKNWNPLADLDNNGLVDFKDLGILLENYGLAGDNFTLPRR